ncbi:hypothetical protein FQA39_LY03600 [Lamprigera yunnana]|nr:hypothetical protein FQA39_LY03600 [Lamprigera yunnana]
MYLLPLLFVAFVDGQEVCSNLAPLYNLFECDVYCTIATINTKYECSESYLTKFVKDKCYFQNAYYEIGQHLPDKYPNMAGNRMCSYQCTNISTDGPFFRPVASSCTATTTPGTYPTCMYELLVHQPSIASHHAPVFISSQSCPLFWLNLDADYIQSDDCSNKPGDIKKKMSQIKLTLAIIKPHIIKNPPSLLAIRNLILTSNFKVVRSKRYLFTNEVAQQFYKEHKGKFFYKRLVSFMTSGESDLYVLGRNNAIQEWRTLMGPTKVFRAQFEEPNSIRGQFGLSDTRNATHGSEFDTLNWYKIEAPYFESGAVVFNSIDFIHKPCNSATLI